MKKDNLYFEIISDKLREIEGGYYKEQWKIRQSPKPLYKIKSKDLKDIKSLEIRRWDSSYSYIYPQLPNLKQLVIFDKQKFPNLYLSYEFFYWVTKFIEMDVKERVSFGAYAKSLTGDISGFPKLKTYELIDFINDLNLQELSSRLEMINFINRKPAKEIDILMEQLYLIKPPDYVKLEKIREIYDGIKNKYSHLIAEFTYANSFLREMKVLGEELPNCQLYY